MTDALFVHWGSFGVGLAGLVFVGVECWQLWRLRAWDGNDPVTRDRRFGHLIGLAIGVLGAIGIAKYHHWIF